MTQEEMTVKLGLNGQEFDTGIDRAKAKAKDFSESTHKSFLHASNGAREFHKALHSVTEASPLLGTALRLAISPIGGLFVAAVTTFHLFHEKLKEINHELDEMQKLNAKPIINIREALHGAASEMARLNLEFGKWMNSHDRGDKTITDALEDQLDALHSQAQVNDKILKQKKEAGLISETEYEHMRKALDTYSIKSEMDAVKAAQGKLGDGRVKANQDVFAARNDAENPVRLREIDTAKQAIKSAEALKAASERHEEAVVPKGTMDYIMQYLTLKHQGTGESLADAQMAAQKEAQEATQNYTKMLSLLTERLEKLTGEQKKAEEKLHEAQHTEDNYQHAQQAVATQLRRLSNKMQTAKDSPGHGVPHGSDSDRGTIDELAQTGGWFTGDLGNGRWGTHWQQGPFAQAAQRVQMLEKTAFNANQWGNFGLRDQARKEADSIRSQLGQAGVLKKEEYEQSMARNMEVLADLASGKSGGGVAIKPKMTQ